MIVLVELLGQVIGIIGYERRRQCRTGFGYLLRILVQQLDYADLLVVEYGIICQRRSVPGLGGLAQYRPYARMGILDEWTGIAVEIYGFLCRRAWSCLDPSL